MKKIILFFFATLITSAGFGQNISDTTVTTTMIYHLVKNGIAVDSVVTRTYTKSKKEEVRFPEPPKVKSTAYKIAGILLDMQTTKLVQWHPNEPPKWPK